MGNIRQYPDFKMRASAGLIEGVSTIFKFGKNQDVDTGTTPEDIHTLGGEKLFPTATSTLSIVSDSSDDATGGTGINTIKVEGLDINYDFLSEEIDLNGLTPVVTNSSFYRVNRAYGVLSGTGQKAAGTITLTHSQGAITEIPVGDGQSSDCTYTVPRNHLLLVDRFTASLERSGSGAGAEIHFEILLYGQNTWREQADASLAASGTSYIQRDTDLWFPIVEKSDVRIHVSQVATNNTFIAASFDGFVIDLAKFAW